MNNEDRDVIALDKKHLLPRFPLSKIKKIAKCDREYIITSNAAIVATSFATELFIQSLAEDGLSMSYLQQDKKSMKRNSKKTTHITDNGNSDTTVKQVRLTLDDLIESVQRNEQFYFLEDVINRKNFNNDSKSSKKDKTGITKNTDTKHTKSNKLLDEKQSVLPFGEMETGVATLKDIDSSDNEDDDDQEETNEENIIDGVEEEEEEETGERTLNSIDSDSDSAAELQREIEKMNTVEDIDDRAEEEEKDDDGDDYTDEKVKYRERLMGREETTEEIFE